MHSYRGWPFLSDPRYPDLSAVWAVMAHGAIGVIVVLPIVLRSERRLLLGALAFIAGPAFDIDHVVVAESLRPQALEHLGHRPDTHSLCTAIACALIALGLTRRRLVAWSVFATLVAHLLFDAAGGGVFWLYPLKQPDAIPWIACPVGIGLLAGTSWILARRKTASQRMCPSAPHSEPQPSGALPR
jgi:membrane-bound metal-dependent hydrolase YbcI (DUF457 family)